MTDPATEIPLDRLREVLDLLVRHVSAQAPGGRLALPADAFWSIPTASLTDICAEPPEPTIGMVSESWHGLEAMLTDEGRVIGHGFVWLADVLRAIGAEAV
ncbi:hypothetical protein [Kitasatospora sp. NBC_01302]|uniref:hypothetical protein n=1 Tax=Kitasatospora sp. NBC_01302 TaxID=2903575 RepID=UPI002E14D3EB|nr:hypothetical protein OG294_34130 [Kitasatospora sp. NBC_01302]